LAARLSVTRIGLFLSHPTATLNSRAITRLVAPAVSRSSRGWSSQSSSRSITSSYRHDITLSRGCLIAGLPLILSERVEHHYKSMGWSLFYEIT